MTENIENSRKVLPSTIVITESVMNSPQHEYNSGQAKYQPPISNGDLHPNHYEEYPNEYYETEYYEDPQSYHNPNQSNSLYQTQADRSYYPEYQFSEHQHSEYPQTSNQKSHTTYSDYHAQPQVTGYQNRQPQMFGPKSDLSHSVYGRKKSTSSDIDARTVATTQSGRENQNTANRFSSISRKSIATERYCFGFFKSQRKCYGFCIPILIIFIGILCLLAFLLWPRLPGFTISQPESFNTLALGTADTLRSASPAKPFIATFSLQVNVTVYSENYIPWNIQQLYIEGSLFDPRNLKSPMAELIGTGKRQITIPPRSQTIFPIIFNAQYISNIPLTKANLMTDPVMAALILACGPDKFGIPPVVGYQTGIIKLQIKPTTTLMGFLNVDATKMDSTIGCPADIAKILDLVFSAIN